MDFTHQTAFLIIWGLLALASIPIITMIICEIVTEVLERRRDPKGSAWRYGANDADD